MPTLQTDVKVAIVTSGKYQYEIAQLAGIPEAVLSRWIRGRAGLRAEQERRLRTVLGLPIDNETQEFVGVGHE